MFNQIVVFVLFCFVLICRLIFSRELIISLDCQVILEFLLLWLVQELELRLLLAS